MVSLVRRKGKVKVFFFFSFELINKDKSLSMRRGFLVKMWASKTDQMLTADKINHHLVGRCAIRPSPPVSQADSAASVKSSFNLGV